VNRSIDGRENAGNVLADLVIPESQETIAIRFEVMRPRLVGRTVAMLPAIELDDDSELMTGEVSEVWTDRRLPSKVMLLERGLSQRLP
jgi:hypothetical protein